MHDPDYLLTLIRQTQALPQYYSQLCTAVPVSQVVNTPDKGYLHTVGKLGRVKLAWLSCLTGSIAFRIQPWFLSALLMRVKAVIQLSKAPSITKALLKRIQSIKVWFWTGELTSSLFR